MGNMLAEGELLQLWKTTHGYWRAHFMQ